MEMIPGLQLPESYRLPKNPNHLKRLQGRRANSSDKNQVSDSFEDEDEDEDEQEEEEEKDREQRKAPMKELLIRLERCDAMLPRYDINIAEASVMNTTCSQDIQTKEMQSTIDSKIVIIDLVSDEHESDDNSDDSHFTRNIRKSKNKESQSEGSCSTGLRKDAPSSPQHSCDVSPFHKRPPKQTYENAAMQDKNQSSDSIILVSTSTDKLIELDLVALETEPSNDEGMKTNNNGESVTNTTDVAMEVETLQNTVPIDCEDVASSSEELVSNGNIATNLNSCGTEQLLSSVINSMHPTQNYQAERDPPIAMNVEGNADEHSQQAGESSSEASTQNNLDNENENENNESEENEQNIELGLQQPSGGNGDENVGESLMTAVIQTEEAVRKEFQLQKERFDKAQENLMMRISGLESETKHLKEAYHQKCAKFKELEEQSAARINSLESALQEKNALIEKNRGKFEKLKQKFDYLAEFKRSCDRSQHIEEIKKTKWCANCQKKAECVTIDPPTCSEECLQIIW